MTDEPDRFDEDDVSLILKRASELQAHAPVTGAMSLAELEEVAAEAGIDRRFIRQAAAGLTRQPRSRFWILGAPTRFSRAVEVEGELAAEHFDAVVSLVRGELGREGKAETILGSLEWRDSTETDRVGVSLTPRRGRTRIDVHTEREQEAGVIVTLTVMASLIPAAFAAWALRPLSIVDVLGLLGGGAAAVWGGSVVWWRYLASTWRGKVDRLAGKLAETVDAAIAGGASREGSGRQLLRGDS